MPFGSTTICSLRPCRACGVTRESTPGGWCSVTFARRGCAAASTELCRSRGVVAEEWRSSYSAILQLLLRRILHFHY